MLTDNTIPAALRAALDAEFPRSTGPVITGLIKADRARAMAAALRWAQKFYGWPPLESFNESIAALDREANDG